MTLGVFGKSLLIAFLAAIASLIAFIFVGLSFATIEGSPMQIDGAVSWVFSIALLGTYCVGVPVALLTFFLARRHLIVFPSALLLIAALACVMLLLTSFFLMGPLGMAVLGAPSVAATATFAGLGWFWIIKPMRRANIG